LNRSTRQLLLWWLLFTCLLGSAGGFAAKSSSALAPAPEEAQPGGESKRELVFKVINFVLLVGALGYLLRKPLANFFLERSTSIRKSLEDGRKALEASQVRLREVEKKLARLEEDIGAFKESSRREMETERDRLRQATAAEAEKILESAQARVEAATRAGILELRQYAAQQALGLAEELIRERLGDSGRQRLVSRFVEELAEP
jgi:F-type H+-transporting ATPase subunit b